jgi:hypothetical protein
MDVIRDLEISYDLSIVAGITVALPFWQIGEVGDSGSDVEALSLGGATPVQRHGIGPIRTEGRKESKLQNSWASRDGN